MNPIRACSPDLLHALEGVRDGREEAKRLFDWMWAHHPGDGVRLLVAGMPD